MGTPIAMTVGPEDSVRVVLNELDKFAAPNKLPPRRLDEAENVRRYGDIDVFLGFSVDDAKPTATFHFVTHDDCELSVTVDFTVLDREYLDRLQYDVRKNIAQHRGQRNGISLVVNNP